MPPSKSGSNSENIKQIVSETTRRRALLFGMQQHASLLSEHKLIEYASDECSDDLAETEQSRQSFRCLNRQNIEKDKK